MPEDRPDNQPPGDPGPGKQPGKPSPRAGRGLFGWVMLLVIISLVVVAIQTGSGGAHVIKWSEFAASYQDGTLKKDTIKFYSGRDQIHAVVDDMGKERRIVVDIKGQRETYIPKLHDMTSGGDFTTISPSPFWQFFTSGFFITIILLVVIWVFLFRGLRSMSGGGGMLGNFGRSKHRVMAKASTGVTFKDVAGIEEAKDEVQEIIQFLKNPKKFARLGGRVPRGVLLAGPPGCGKTLLAKAIAGEADVPFFSISGSDFVEMFVGVGASRVRDLFKQAKENSPCIIFLDEIDAVGRKRGSGFTTGGHDEREQTLNAILVEMDGFETSDQVIVIAATNREDVLDPALTRPGRFDRRVNVQLPDVKGRLQILRVHATKIKLGPDVDMEKIARGTPMFSGAELAAITNEAAIIATMADKEFVEHADLEEARDKVRFGRQRKSRVVEQEERVATAYHEAGHAVLQMLLPNTDPLHKVTIIPRGQAMGSSMSLPEKDRYGYSRKWLLSTMRVLCGGRIAEETKTEDVSSGAAMDIEQMTRIARTMVLQWGMSDRLGFIQYDGHEERESLVSEREYSEETARVIDEEVRGLADAAYTDAQRLIKDNWQKIHDVAEALLRHETLSADEVAALMRGEVIAKPSVAELLAQETKNLTPPTKKPSKKTAEDRDDGVEPGALPSPA